MDQQQDKTTGGNAATKTSDQTYIYRPLSPDEIRILVLSPGQQDEPLRARLETIRRSKKPKYKAISYAWGDPVFPHALELPEGRLYITESLFGALKCFRSETEPVKLWADAVCINQNGIREKNHQVAHMHAIFEQAEMVLVWLGDAQASDCLVYYYLWKLGCAVDLLPKKKAEFLHTELLLSSPGRERWGTCRDCGSKFIITGGESLLDALRAFHRRPWFRRLWVIQEIYCAEFYTLYFGSHHVISPMAGRAYNKQKELPGFGITEDMHEDLDTGPNEFPQSSPITMTNASFKDKPSPWLLEALFHTKRAICSSPHDRVYAIRRLACVDTINLLTPDYDMSIKDLWMKVAIVELTSPFVRGRRYETFPSPILPLALAGLQRKFEDVAEPSWVPDFENLTVECTRKYEFYKLHAYDNWAGGRSQTDVTVKENPHLLRIRSRCISRVKTMHKDTPYQAIFCEASKSETEDAFWTRVSENVFPWFAKCIDLASSRSVLDILPGKSLLGLVQQEDDGEDTPLRFDIKNATDGAGREDIRWIPNQAAIKGYEKWLESTHATIRPRVGTVSIKYALYRLFRNDYFRGKLLDRTRVLASTSAGSVGWIPEASEPGDAIMLLQGSPFPFILRERSDGNYSVVGDAYIQSVMHGEAWPQVYETGVKWIGIK